MAEGRELVKGDEEKSSGLLAPSPILILCAALTLRQVEESV